MPNYKEFTKEVLSKTRDCMSLDGSDIQEIGVKTGVLRDIQVTESCGSECVCADMGFPATCFESVSDSEALEDMRQEASDLLNEAEKALHRLAVALPLGKEREFAFEVFERVRLARRK